MKSMKHESAEARRVLFVTYGFPPSIEMGAYSCAQIARYLPFYGWEPVVLTVKEKYIDDQHLGQNDADRVNGPDLIIRTSKFPHPSDIYRRFKSRSTTVKASYDGGRKAVSPPDGANGKSALRTARDLLLSLSCVPDKYNGWLIPAVAAGLRAIIRTRAGVICSSAPYFTSHLAGYWLAVLTGLPWVAHFRDPWITGLHAERRPDKICFKINHALERLTISRADVVICVTEEHAALLRQAYDHMPASKFAVVMNGFDGLEWQELIESIPPSAPGEGYAADAPRKFRITYAGELYMKRDPAPLFRALRSLIDDGEIGRGEAIVEFIGSCDAIEGRGMADIVSEAGIEGYVEMRGRLSHPETLRRLLQSDLLLLLSEKQLIEIPGKTFEYLKTRRPILALTYEGAVATLLRRTGGAWVVSPDDQHGVIHAVRESYRLWKRGLPGPAPDPLVVESFDRRRTTGRIAELLDFLTG
jgi:glycosyltransferase involved in cell wall biosynthesis